MNDRELNSKVKELAQKERQLTRVIVEYIAEVDRRKLYLALSYDSLFSYLTKEVGYSANAAQRRIDAARLFQRLPEVSKKIEAGSIHMGQISQIQKVYRQIKKAGEKVSIEAQRNLLEKIENKTSEQTHFILAKELNVHADPEIKLTFGFTQEEVDILKKAQALLSNKTGGSVKETILIMARKAIADAKAKSTTTVVVEPRKSVTPKLRKFILNKDQACQFKTPDGRVCGSQFFLEIDHIRPRFAEGAHDATNLRVLCRNHNQYRYRMGR